MISKIQTFGLLAPAVVMLLVIGVWPLALVAFYSVHENFGSEAVFVGSQWYAQAYFSSDFQNNMLRSLGFSVLALAIELPLGLLIALSLPRKGKLLAALVVLLVLPLLTPNIVVGYLFKALSLPHTGLLTWVFSAVGLDLNLNSPVTAWCVIVLMDVWHWTSLVVLFAYAGLKAIPEEYYYAARVDAASAWGIFRHVQWPRLKLMLAIAAILRFMDTFMIYAEPLAVTHGGPKTATSFVASAFFQSKKTQFELGFGAAISMTCFVIVVGFAFVLFKLLTRQGLAT
ncbi:MAG: sugar ABC transporter permease [Aestuariivirga sp.]